MIHIYLIDSDKKAIADFVNYHEELFENTNEHFKDKNQEGIPVGEVCKQLQAVCQSVQDLLQIQNWTSDACDSENLRASSSPAQRASTSCALAHDISRGSTDKDSMEISMQSDTIIHSSVTSPNVVSQHSTVDQLVMDQFAEMKTMLSSFLGPRQGTIRTAFWKLPGI